MRQYLSLYWTVSQRETQKKNRKETTKTSSQVEDKSGSDSGFSCDEETDTASEAGETIETARD